MINLAGKKDCDKHIIDELTRAGIDTVQLLKSNSEVPYKVIGVLDHYTFKRAWYYWVVSGDTPMDLAKKIYAHPEGKATVRAGGHCGCEPPETQSRLPLGKDGMELITQEEIDRTEKKYPNIEKSDIWKNILNTHRVATSEEQNNKVVNGYHIDSQAGLLLFSMMIKEYFNLGDKNEK